MSNQETNSSETPSRSLLLRVLFPEEERRFPGERQLRALLRTAHIVAMAVLVGGHFYDAPRQALLWPLALSVGTGFLFMLLELHGSFDWLFQVRGLITIAKIVLVLLIPTFWDHRMWLLLPAVAIASLSSHMSSGFRYYSILSRKEGEHKKG